MYPASIPPDVVHLATNRPTTQCAPDARPSPPTVRCSRGCLTWPAATTPIKAMKITARELRALASIELQGSANKDGYVQLLVAIRGVTKA